VAAWIGGGRFCACGRSFVTWGENMSKIGKSLFSRPVCPRLGMLMLLGVMAVSAPQVAQAAFPNLKNRAIVPMGDPVDQPPVSVGRGEGEISPLPK